MRYPIKWQVKPNYPQQTNPTPTPYIHIAHTIPYLAQRNTDMRT